MKVLVTGGCGFLGSHICELFRAKGWDVVAYDSLTKYELNRTGYDVEQSRRYNVEFLASIGARVVKEDVRDLATLRRHAEDVDFIAHTAAQPAMTISWEDPQLDFSTNAAGTFNVLEVARARGIPVASCSSIHTYGTGINDEIREEGSRYVREPAAIAESHASLTGQLTPLHASKYTGEVYTQAYAHTYGVKAATFRYTGIYGPRQFGAEDHGWVANFTIRNLTGRAIRIFGTGKQTRDILYASDAARAFWDYVQQPVAGVYNIGGGPQNAISLIESIRLIESVTGQRAEVIFDVERQGDLRYFVSDITRARGTFGFEPAVQPREGITALAQWARENLPIFATTV